MSPSGETPDVKPGLHLVNDSVPAEVTATAPKAPMDAEPEPRQSTPSAPSTSHRTWLLFAASLLFAWLWLTQLEKANGLAADLAATEAGLAAARSDIAAWQAHGAQVQSGVDGIAAQLGALQELLADAPTTGTELPLGANTEAGLAQEAVSAE